MRALPKPPPRPNFGGLHPDPPSDLLCVPRFLVVSSIGPRVTPPECPQLPPFDPQRPQLPSVTALVSSRACDTPTPWVATFAPGSALSTPVSWMCLSSILTSLVRPSPSPSSSGASQCPQLSLWAALIDPFPSCAFLSAPDFSASVFPLDPSFHLFSAFLHLCLPCCPLYSPPFLTRFSLLVVSHVSPDFICPCSPPGSP